MNQNKLTFESENLAVGFLRFNLQFIDKYEIKKVAEYLPKQYSCNNVFIDKKTLRLYGEFFPIEFVLLKK